MPEFPGPSKQPPDARSSHQVTALLKAVTGGDAASQEQLWMLVYDELRRVARRQMRSERGNKTLQTTALVNEAYLRLLGDGDGVDFANRRHFFAAAANAMRHIRIDYARNRNAVKRGGSSRRGSDVTSGPAGQAAQRVPLEAIGGASAIFDDDPAELLAIDEALRKLEQREPLRAEVVKLRYFAGLNREEIASAMGIAVQTVDKYWRLARAWLHRELTTDG